MRASRWLLLSCVLLAIVALESRPSADGPNVTFHVIGDIDGPGNDAALTVIKDAVKSNGVIYAVGGAISRFVCIIANGCVLPSGTDTPILWRFDGTNATLDPLPDLSPNTLSSPLN